MSIKSFFRRILHKSSFGIIMINYKRAFMQKINKLLSSDIRTIYKKYNRLGHDLDLREPKRFTEKLQWLKLFYRNEDMIICADKIAIRDFLTQKGYGEYLVPLACDGTYRSVKEINFGSLPEKCILKASHGSSMHLVKTSNQYNQKSWKKIMNSWLKMDISFEGREWPYHHVKPGIICEEFMMAQTDNKLRDYKFFCFNGRPKYIQVDSDLLENHHIDFYDIEWNRLPIRCQYPNSDLIISKPHGFDKMIEIAMDLSKDFPHVRVDFYQYDDQLRIGELTFFDGSGFYNFYPDEYDFIFGDLLQLPEPNYNLELYKKIQNGK